jgi:hypothetical protein
MLITILNVNRRHLSDFESYLSLKQNKELVKQGEIGKNHEKVRVAEATTLKTLGKRPGFFAKKRPFLLLQFLPFYK